MIRKKDDSGFTLIELMISTAVFSVVLLIATISIILISKNYTRGQVTIQTQNTVQSILNNISNAIKYNNLSTLNFSNLSTATNRYFCIGNNVYYFNNLNQLLGSNSSAVGLVEYTSPSCNRPTSVPSGASQLLSNNERLGQLSITDIGTTSHLYQIDIEVAYGNDSVLTTLNPAGPPPYKYRCNDSYLSTSFCSIDSETVTVSPRLMN